MTAQEAQIKTHKVPSEAQQNTFFTVKVGKQWKKFPGVCGVSILGDTQKLTGDSDGQHASAGPP